MQSSGSKMTSFDPIPEWRNGSFCFVSSSVPPPRLKYCGS
jgi:hypothetical protein